MVDRVGRECGDRPYKLTVTRGFMGPNLLRGVPPDFVNAVDRKPFPMLLNEADGAASFSIKIPREGEPVLMENANYLVPVIGLDCLNQPVGPKTLFRFQTLGERFSLREGEIITPKLAASVLMHPRGVCRDWRAGTKILPFINKVDNKSQDAAARDLAILILRNGSFPVSKVLCGSVLQGRVDSISVA
jgi:probable selenium-dependent hydroxylase accessory protein YqeC